MSAPLVAALWACAGQLVTLVVVVVGAYSAWGLYLRIRAFEAGANARSESAAVPDEGVQL